MWIVAGSANTLQVATTVVTEIKTRDRGDTVLLLCCVSVDDITTQLAAKKKGNAKLIAPKNPAPITQSGTSADN